MSSKLAVAVLGASPKPDRYSYRAVQDLLAHGYRVFPVRPGGAAVCGVESFVSLGDLPAAVDTLTVYVNADRSDVLAPDILRLKPRRIIFNPGSENPDLEALCRAQGIVVLRACTLVLLATDNF